MSRENIQELDSINIPLQGVNLIEAAAGTGKTHNIQNLAARMIVEKNFPISSIVIVTFTEKAAGELTDRLRIVLEALLEKLDNKPCSDPSQQERAATLLAAFDNRDIPRELQRQRLQDALRDFDENRVSTIHGFCARVLTENAFESSVAFRIKLEQNMKSYTDKLLNDFCRRQRYAPRPLPGIDKLNSDELNKRIAVMMRKDAIKLQFSRDVYESAEDIYAVLDDLHAQLLDCRLQEVKDFLTGKLKKIGDDSGDDYINKHITSLAALLKRSEISGYMLHQTISHLHPEILLNNLKSKTAAEAIEFITDPENGKLFEIAQKYCQIADEDCRVYWELSAFKFVSEQLSLWKKRDNFQGFDDLLTEVQAALNRENSPLLRALQKQFNAGIIDEFQDTDPIQYDIFKKIFIERLDQLFFMVGDPRQAIYSFRGGDLATYMRAAGECSSKFGLNTNYRSSAPLIAAFNIIFDHNNAFASNEITFNKVLTPAKPRPGITLDGVEIDLPISLEYIPYTREIGNPMIRQQCAYEIVRLLNSKRFKLPDGDNLRDVTPGDIAVLAYDRYILDEIRHELQKFNIPVIADDKNGVWKSPEAAALELFMRNTLNSSSNSSLRETLLSDICGIPLSELDKTADDAAEKLARWRVFFQQLKNCWLQSGTAAMLRKLSEEFQYKQRWARCIGGERRIANFTQVGDLLTTAEMHNQLTPHGVLKFLQEKIASPAQDEASAEMLESDRSAVKLMTIHASKGLQFPIVFLPELTNRYPLQKKSLKIYHFNGELCCNPDESIFTAQMQAGIEELQEIMRLVYVAITRACYYCRIVWTDLIRNRQLVSCTPLDWLFRMRHVDCSNLDDTLINFITQTQEELLPYQLPEPLCRHKPFGDAMPKVLPPADNLLNIHTPQTVAQVADSWRITSYSALPLGSSQPKPQWAENANEAADYDLADASSADTQQPNVPANGVWEITAGAAIGNAWHKILENMDFTSPVNTEYVAGVMRLFNFTDPAAHAASCDMFEKLLDHTLPCGMQLRTLTAERKITELEFLLDCRNGFDIDELCDAVQDHIAGEFGTAVSPSNYFSMRGGFFTGFIDMIFEYNGKFYIVDWKSNTLNKDPQEFYGERLKMNMAKKNYHIQYLCYCAALMKYLAWKLHRNIDNELYEQFFGGVYYIFLRGLTLPEPGGIFSARPPFAAIKSLTDVISPGKEADNE